MKCADNGGVEEEEAGSMNGSCTEIVIVRHGETDWNALGKMQVR